MIKGNQVFEDLFVLEVANNHLGKLERGKKLLKNLQKLSALIISKLQ